MIEYQWVLVRVIESITVIYILFHVSSSIKSLVINGSTIQYQINLYILTDNCLCTFIRLVSFNSGLFLIPCFLNYIPFHLGKFVFCILLSNTKYMWQLNEHKINSKWNVFSKLPTNLPGINGGNWVLTNEASNPRFW